MMFGWFDPMYLLYVAPALLLALWAQFRVKVTYAQAQQMPAPLSGAAAARHILDSAGLQKRRHRTNPRPLERPLRSARQSAAPEPRGLPKPHAGGRGHCRPRIGPRPARRACLCSVDHPQRGCAGRQLWQPGGHLDDLCRHRFPAASRSGLRRHRAVRLRRLLPGGEPAGGIQRQHPRQSSNWCSWASSTTSRWSTSRRCSTPRPGPTWPARCKPIMILLYYLMRVNGRSSN